MGLSPELSGPAPTPVAWAQGKFLLPDWGKAQQEELWHTVSVWIVSPSPTEDTEAHKLPHIQDFLVFCKDSKKVKRSPTSSSYSRLFYQLLDYNITFLNWSK